MFCDTLLDELEKLPGDSRTQIGFITYDRVVHFYSMSDGATQPTQLVSEIVQLGPIWAVETGPNLGNGYLPSTIKCCLKISGRGLFVRESNTSVIVSLLEGGNGTPEK